MGEDDVTFKSNNPLGKLECSPTYVTGISQQLPNEDSLKILVEKQQRIHSQTNAHNPLVIGCPGELIS